MNSGFKSSLGKRIGGFDELRGVAVLMVLVAHWGLLWPLLKKLNGGPIGVDIFFVISGFLIGKILYKSLGEKGYYRNFYVRRAFRILPLAIVIIMIGYLTSLLLGRNTESIIYYLTFTQNYIPAFAASNLGQAVDVLPLVGTSPMWSLAVEEQVYIFLPLLLGVVPRKYISLVLLAIATLGVAFFLNTTSNFAGTDDWYTNYRETWNRMHYIAIGALISRRDTTVFAYITTVILGVGVVYTGHITLLVQVAILFLIIYTVVHLREERKFISSTPLKWCGERCYGIYLIHYPIVAGLKVIHTKGMINTTAMLFIACLFYVIMTLMLSWLSFKYFEMPIQRRRTKFEI